MGRAMPDHAKRSSSNTVGSIEAVASRLGEIYRVDRAPSLVTTSLRADNLILTEIQSSNPEFGVTAPVPVEDSYLLSVLMKDLIDFQAWEDGCAMPKRTFRAGESMLRDLKKKPAALIDQPLHHLVFYLPRAAIDQLADDAGAPRIEELRYRPDDSVSDPIVKSLAAALAPAFAVPEQANRLFVDHVLRAMGLHVASTYGGLKARSKTHVGGLAAWQEKRAKEMLAGDLTGNLSLADIASECGLSVGQFSRGFKQSTGLPPHRWLLERRVEAAKRYMGDRAVPLSEVAQICGFADQSHLTRVFARHTGLTPAAWRRAS